MRARLGVRWPINSQKYGRNVLKKRPTTNKPTPKPLPSADEQRKQLSYTRYVCAVWWGSGYGTKNYFQALFQAREYAETLAPMGYPKWRKTQVHVWKETSELIDVIESPEPEEVPE